MIKARNIEHTAPVVVYSLGYYTFVTLEQYDKMTACMFVDNWDDTSVKKG